MWEWIHQPLRPAKVVMSITQIREMCTSDEQVKRIEEIEVEQAKKEDAEFEAALDSFSPSDMEGE